jgi:NNP family nitrate/nitrite transporter-like MFS transporter
VLTSPEPWFSRLVDNANATRSATGALPGVNLTLATCVSAVNFWAWNVIGPLSTIYAARMSLNSIEVSLYPDPGRVAGPDHRRAVG